MSYLDLTLSGDPLSREVSSVVFILIVEGKWVIDNFL